MALLFMDGFAASDYQVKWDAYTANIFIQTATPRVAGSTYLRMHNNNPSYLAKVIPATSELFIGCGFRLEPESGTGFGISFYGDSATTVHLTVIRNTTTNLMELRRGDGFGTLLATGSTTIYMQTWHYLEIRVTIADAGGVCQVRLDGATTNDIDFTGDTKNGGTSTSVDYVQFNTAGYSYCDSWISDIYMLNTTGAANNTWRGDVAIRTLVPTGNGNYSQLTGSDADQVNNYQLVDEFPVSSADYVGSPTTGLKDSYVMSDLPGGVSQVFAVQSNLYAAKSDATAAGAKALLRTGGSDYYGSTKVLSTSYQIYSDIFETNPNTAIAWTAGDVNGLESGMEVA